MLKKVLVLSVFATLFIYGNGSANAGMGRLYEDKILGLLEDLRVRMCYGDPDGLPQLEPLTIDSQLDLDLNLAGFGNIAGYLRNIKVEGLSTFLVEYLTFAITLKFNFTMAVPKLVLSGEYALKADLGGFIELDGEGKFRLTAGGINLGASGSLIYNQGMSLQAVKLAIKLATVESAIENLSPDEEVNEFLNDVISELVPKVVDEYLPEDLIASLEALIEDFATDYLKDMTAAELLAMISGSGGSLFPPLDEERACKFALTGGEKPNPPIIETLPGIM